MRDRSDVKISCLYDGIGDVVVNLDISGLRCIKTEEKCIDHFQNDCSYSDDDEHLSFIQFLKTVQKRFDHFADLIFEETNDKNIYQNNDCISDQSQISA